MALEIVWTKRAEKGYDKIIGHLKKEWADREISIYKGCKAVFRTPKKEPPVV